MTRFLLFLLLFQFATDSSILTQLAKFPVLIEHYQEHKQLNSEVRFTEFLSMHYWGTDLDDDDDDRDNQLPFKSVDIKTVHFLYFQPSRAIAVKAAAYGFSRSYPLYRFQDFSDPLVGGLFKPPRV